jgi:hypothetical protein
MRTNFNNPELTHIWANQTQSHGKGSSMFFENESIYSYGHHFKIAQIIEHNGKKAVLFNDARYSNTTNKHQILVKRAVPSDYPLFIVNSFPDTMPIEMMHSNNLKNYLSKADDLRQKVIKATKSKDGQINLINIQIDSFKKYCQFYGINDLSVFTSKSSQGLSIEDRFAHFQNWVYEYTSSEKYINWQYKKIERERIAFEKALSDNIGKIKLFRDFKVSSIYANLGHYLLRYNKETDNIETSGGVKMPKHIFLSAYQRLLKNELKQGQHVGDFRFNGLDGEIVSVGCHRIPMTEIKNIVAVL